MAALCPDVDALLSRAAPYVAPATTPPIDTPEGELETLFTGPFNVTGGPAVVLPCGYSEGLPLGLQLAAAFGADQELLQQLLDPVRLSTAPTGGGDRCPPASHRGCYFVARLRLAPEAVGDAVFVGVPVTAQV